MTEAIISRTPSRNALFIAAAGGVLTGILTPLIPPLIGGIGGAGGDFRIALVAMPFAVLVLLLVRHVGAKPWSTAAVAAIITMIAFVCAVNAAIWVDSKIDAGKVLRSVGAGLAGGLIGSAVMALGISRLPMSPRHVSAWLPMLIVGTFAGSLLALDNALELDLTSVLYPVWQAGVAAALTLALRRTNPV